MKKICSLVPLLLTGCAASHIDNQPATALVDSLLAQQIPIINAAHDALFRVTSTKTNQTLYTTLLPNTRRQISPTLSELGYSVHPPQFIVAGHANSLGEAVSTLVPPSWQTLFVGVDPKQHKNISWQGNDEWDRVLAKILPNHLKAEVNWNIKQVVIGEKQGSLTIKHDRTAVKPLSLAKTPPVATQQHWDIAAGVTLKDALSNWAATATCSTLGVNHWSLSWQTPINYRVDAPLHFNGDFKEALNQLFTLYGDAQKPLFAGTQSQQCILVVDDKAM